jgi:hypothetical protein
MARKKLLLAIFDGCVCALPKKSVWNFQALKTPAFIEAGEFQTPFLGWRASFGKFRVLPPD